MRIPPDLQELEDHGTGYGQKGSLSHIVFPRSVCSIPQVANDLIAAVMKARLDG